MKLIRDQRGSLAEYATMIALMAVMALPAVSYVGIQAADVYCVQTGKAENEFKQEIGTFNYRFSWAINETGCMCCIKPSGGWGMPGGCPANPNDC